MNTPFEALAQDSAVSQKYLMKDTQQVLAIKTTQIESDNSSK